MRDPNRIPIILSELQQIWEKYPDLRLAQLLVNLMHVAGSDLYYIEDASLIKMLKDYYHVD